MGHNDGMRLIFAVLSLLNAVAIRPAQAAPAPAIPAADPLVAISARLRAHAALAGEFTQTSRSGLSGIAHVESGRCVITRDGDARFDFMKPAGKLALAHGGFFILYEPRDKQLTRQRLGADTAPSLLYAAPEKLRARFALTLVAVADGGQTITLRPKDADGAWSEITITLGQDGLPLALSFHDGTGGQVDLTFNLKPAAPPAPAFYEFTPPEGTEFVGE